MPGQIIGFAYRGLRPEGTFGLEPAGPLSPEAMALPFMRLVHPDPLYTFVLGPPATLPSTWAPGDGMPWPREGYAAPGWMLREGGWQNVHDLLWQADDLVPVHHDGDADVVWFVRHP